MGNGASCGCCASDVVATDSNVRRNVSVKDPPRQGHAAWQTTTTSTSHQWQAHSRPSTRGIASVPQPDSRPTSWTATTMPGASPAVERRKSDSFLDSENRQAVTAVVRDGFAPRGGGSDGSHPHIPQGTEATAASSTSSGDYELPEEQAQEGTAAVASYELTNLSAHVAPYGASTRVAVPPPPVVHGREPPQLGGSVPHHYLSNAPVSRNGYHWDDDETVDEHRTGASDSGRLPAQSHHGNSHPPPSSGGGAPHRVIPATVRRRYSSGSSGDSSLDSDDDGGPMEDAPCAKY